MHKRKVRAAIPPMRLPVARHPTHALWIPRGRVTIAHLEVLCCVMRENTVKGRHTESGLEPRGAATLECECSVLKESIEAASCASDFVQRHISCLGGGIVIKKDEDAGEDVKVEADRYPGHDNLQSRKCFTTTNENKSSTQ